MTRDSKAVDPHVQEKFDEHFPPRHVEIGTPLYAGRGRINQTRRGKMTAAGTGARKLVLLHISDIHFRKTEIESNQDLDEDIRTKLLHDLARSGMAPGTPFDGILVTGDIAFGGDVSEYGSARRWLKTLCAKAKCKESHIWTVPGNHDVVRSVAHSPLIFDMHSAVRMAPNPALALKERLGESAAANALLSPFTEYNRFAEQLQCETTAESEFWESVDLDLPLNDGSHIRLRGINSSILSDKTGDHGPPNGPATEVVGLKQVQLRDEDEGICYLTLCHHPPEWLRDGDALKDHLSRARIQLFGHKHKQRVSQVDNSLVLGAGALHPNRYEDGWEPRYNILCMEVRSDATGRKLHVDVYQRVWKPADTHFGPHVDADGLYPKPYDLDLPAWSPPPQTECVPAAPPSSLQPSAQVGHENKETMISIRELVFNFFALSYPVRMRLLLDLHLIDDVDDKISDSELVKRAIKRARERDVLLQLDGAIRADSRPKE